MDDHHVPDVMAALFAMMTPFVADLLLVQLRSMRFTFDLITMAINERNYVSAAPISSDEYTEGLMSAASSRSWRRSSPLCGRGRAGAT